MGDVRLTLVIDSGVRRVICAVRRRAARTPAEMADLAANLAAAGDFLRRERAQWPALRRDGRRGAAVGQLAPV